MTRKEIHAGHRRIEDRLLIEREIVEREIRRHRQFTVLPGTYERNLLAPGRDLQITIGLVGNAEGDACKILNRVCKLEIHTPASAIHTTDFLHCQLHQTALEQRGKTIVACADEENRIGIQFHTAQTTGRSGLDQQRRWSGMPYLVRNQHRCIFINDFALQPFDLAAGLDRLIGYGRHEQTKDRVFLQAFKTFAVITLTPDAYGFGQQLLCMVGSLK